MSSMICVFVNVWKTSMPRLTTLRNTSAMPSLWSLPWTVMHGLTSGKCRLVKHLSGNTEGAIRSKMRQLTTSSLAILTIGKNYLWNQDFCNLATQTQSRTEGRTLIQHHILEDTHICGAFGELWCPINALSSQVMTSKELSTKTSVQDMRELVLHCCYQYLIIQN